MGSTRSFQSTRVLCRSVQAGPTAWVIRMRLNRTGNDFEGDPEEVETEIRRQQEEQLVRYGYGGL